MKLLKYTQYAYLIAGILFLVDGAMKLNSGDSNAYIILGLGVVAIGMFFFRRKFAKKFEEKNNN
ncbi:MAG: LPXTG cell wall anchor domain-containing protein [Flavobacterium sp.]|nr:LPXTG cell wall anchor domain-containing protein [Flavobacterium sp.]